jgi:hypothetical protein
MMAASLRVTLQEKFSYEGLISRKKAQRAQKEWTREATVGR